MNLRKFIIKLNIQGGEKIVKFGIGIGGTAEKAAVLAKEVLMDPIDIQELRRRGPPAPSTPGKRQTSLFDSWGKAKSKSFGGDAKQRGAVLTLLSREGIGAETVQDVNPQT